MGTSLPQSGNLLPFVKVQSYTQELAGYFNRLPSARNNVQFNLDLILAHIMLTSKTPFLLFYSSITFLITKELLYGVPTQISIAFQNASLGMPF